MSIIRKWHDFLPPAICALEPPVNLSANCCRLSAVTHYTLAKLEGVSFGKAGTLTSTMVAAFYTQEDVVVKCLRVMGLGSVPIGSKFKCILHPEEHPSASIMRPESPSQPFMYVDFHEREPGRKGFPLPLVYYRWMTGQTAAEAERLPKPSFFIWSLRLLRDAGVISGVKIQSVELPPDVHPHVSKVFQGFCDLLSLRFLVQSGAPCPYTWAFAQGWTGLARRAVERSMRWLLSRGFLRFVRYYGDQGTAARIMLFLLGTRALIRRRENHDLVDGGQKAVVETVATDIEAMHREQGARQQSLLGAVWKAVLDCLKCGPVQQWYQMPDFAVCGTCFGQINTS